MNSSRRPIGLALLVCAAALPSVGSAQTTIGWNGVINTTTAQAWNTTGNWVGGNVPNTDTEIASLVRDYTAAPTVNLGSAITINGLAYDDTGASSDVSLTIGNGGNAAYVLTLAGTGPTITATGFILINASIAGTGFTKLGSQTVSLAGNNSGLSGAITVNAGAVRTTTLSGLGTVSTLNLNAANFEFLTGATLTSFTQAVNVTGSATLFATNAYVGLSGATTLAQDATLNYRGQGGGNNRFAVTSNVALAAGATSANVTFQVDSANTHTYSGTMNLGSGNLTKSSTARLDTSGTLRLGTITASGGTFNVNSTVIGQGGADGQSITLAGNNSAIVAGSVTATTLTKSGTGVFELQSASNSIGSLVITGGAIGIGSATALSSAIPITLSGGGLTARGALRVVSNAITVSAGTTSGLANSPSGDLALTGVVSGSGNLAYDTGFAQTLWLSGDLSGYTGTITYNARADLATSGSLAFGGVDGVSADGTGGSNLSNAKLVIQGANSLRTVTWEGTSGTTVRLGELSSAAGEGRIGTGASGRHANWEVGALGTDSTYGGAFVGAETSLTKVGNGTLTLSGDNSHGGGTTVSGGTLALGAAQRLSDTGAVTVSGGTLALGAFNETIGAFTLVSGSVSGTGILQATGFDVRSGSASAILSGSGGLTKTTSGTVALGGANSFAGVSSVQEGHLSLSAGGSLASAVNVASGAAFGGRGAVTEVNLVAGAALEGGHLGLGALAADTVGADGQTIFRLRSAGVGGGLSAYAAGTGITAIGIGTLNLAEGATVKLQVVGDIGTVANGTYAFLTYGNLTQFDLATFIKPESSDLGSALGPRQNTSIAYASESDNTLLLTILGINPTWVGDQVAGVWSGADNWRLGSQAGDPRTSFLARDTVRFDDTGAGGVISLAQDAALGVANVVADTVDYTFAAAGGGFTSGILNKSGAATLTLTGAHQLASVNLSGGALRVGSAASLGSANLVLAGGRLQSSGALTLANATRLAAASTLGDATDNGALTFTSRLDLDGKSSELTVVSDVTLAAGLGNGGLRKLGAGTLTLGDDALGLTSAHLAAGRVRLGSALSLGSAPLALAGGALSSDSATARTLAGAVTLAADSTLGHATDNGALTFTGGLIVGDADARTLTVASDVTFATGVVSGAAAWTKAGAGQLTLSAANTFAGALTVSGGTLKLGNALALGASTAGTSVLAGATLDLAGFRAVGEVYTIAGSGTSGQGALVNTGADLWNGGVDHLVLSADASVGGSGRFDIRQGAKIVDLAGFRLTKLGSMYMALVDSTVTDGDIRVEGGTLSFSGTTLVQGTGAVTVATGGTLEVGWGAQAANITRNLVLAGGVLYSGGTTGGANSAITLEADGTLSVVSGTTQTLGGVISGGFALSKIGGGTTVLGGDSTYSGGTTVAAGTLQVGAGGASGSILGGVTVASGANLAFNRTDESTFADLITGAGNVVHAGSGVTVLTAANDYTGSTTVNAGTLAFDRGAADYAWTGSLAGAGTFEKRGSGTLTLANANTLTGTFRLSGSKVLFANAASLGAAGAKLSLGGGAVLANSSGAAVTLAANGAGAIDGNVTFGEAGNASAMTLGGTFAVTNNPTLTFNAPVTFNNNLTGNFSVVGSDPANIIHFNKTNRVVNGTVTLSGANTVALWSQTNGLDAGGSTAVIAADGAVARVTGVNNYRTAFRLGADGLGGGVLEAGTTFALRLQAGSSVVVSGTSRSYIKSYNSDTNSNGIDANGGAGSIVVNVTGDPSGVDLEYQAAWKNGIFTKTGLGTVRLGAGYIMNRADNLTAFLTTNAVAVNEGTFINEGTIKSVTSVGGGTLQVGATTGTFDQINVNSGTFELSRVTDLLTPGLEASYAAGHKGMNLKGGTLRYEGISDDISGLLGDLVGASTVDTNGQDVTFASALAGTGGLAKSGLGTLTLAAANTYAGGTTVSAGTLLIGNVGSLGAGDVTLAGGVLDLANLNPDNAITLAGGTLANDANWTGPIAINGDLTAAQINALGRSTITVKGGTIDVTGVTKNLVLEGGALSGFGGLAGNVTIKTSVTLDADPTGTVTLLAGGTLDLGGRVTTKAVTYSGGAFANAASYTGDVTLALAAPAALATGTFGGGRVVIGTGQSATLGANYAGNVLLTGTGSLLGASLIGYSGQVTLGAGASLSLTDAGQGGFLNNRNAAFLLQSGSFLRGKGRIGDVIVLAGATLAPGDSPGLLELGNTTLNGGAFLELEIWRASDPVDPALGGTAGVDYDSVDVAGTLDLSALSASSRYLIDIISLTGDGTTRGSAAIFDPDGEYSFTLFSYDQLNLGANVSLGTNLSSLFALDTTDLLDEAGDPIAANRFSVINDSATSSIVLTYAAIPEPSTYGLALGALAFAVAAIRRRRRQGMPDPSGTVAQS